MLTITAQTLEEADIISDDLGCSTVDYASVLQAHLTGKKEFNGCHLDVAWVIFMKPEEDMTIPVFMCSVHFNAYKLAIRTGRVAVDLDVFGDID